MVNERFKVEGMSCGHCQSAVTKALKGLPGVEAVEVSLEKNEASVAFDPQKVTPDDLSRAVEEAGYKLVTA